MSTTNVPIKKPLGDVAKFTPEEIFERIEQLRESLPAEPTVLEQWFSAGKRDLAKQISQTQVETLAARRELIRGLTTCVSVYVDAHRSDLRVRSSGYITATFVKLTGSLYEVNEQVMISFLDSYSSFVQQIDGNSNLDESQKRDLIANAYRRAIARINTQESSFNDILDQIRTEVNRMIAELGERK